MIVFFSIDAAESFPMTRTIFETFSTMADSVLAVKTIGSYLLFFFNTILALAAYFTAFLFLSSIPLIPYIGIRFALAKRWRQRLTYSVIENFEYWRDDFPHLSPASVSLLMDLKINHKRDLAATLLKYYRNNWIDFYGENIVVLLTEDVKLRKSDQMIFSQLSEGISPWHINLKGWSEQCIIEAKKEGLVTENKEEMAFIKTLVKFVLIFIVLVVLGNAVKYISELPMFISTPVLLLHPMEHNMSAQETGAAIVVVLLILVYLFIYIAKIAIGFSAIIYCIVYSAKKIKLKRTREGNILAEQLAGLQRFIHDFSILSEASKEQVVLWNDFLIHAVVLEENTEIVQEISCIRKVDLNEDFIVRSFL